MCSLDVWSGDLQVYTSMVMHDTECPYWGVIKQHKPNPTWKLKNWVQNFAPQCPHYNTHLTEHNPELNYCKSLIFGEFDFFANI